MHGQVWPGKPTDCLSASICHKLDAEPASLHVFVDTVAFRARFFCIGLAALQTHLKDKEKDSVFSWHVFVVALLGQWPLLL